MRLDEAGGDLFAKFVGELALLVDGLQNRLLALVEFLEVGETLLDLADLNLVKVAVRLLAVARDERHGRPLGEELLDRRHLRRGKTQFARDLPRD